LMASAAAKNGMASPNEYAASSWTPSPIVRCVPAMARMPARIGPMHGVHPKAKAIPTSVAPMNQAGRRFVCTRFSW
jgi:hypothetical protein